MDGVAEHLIAERLVAERLVAHGMSADAAAAKGRLFASAAAALGGEPTTAWFVPGRIEFLGKHTDYAGGRSLLCAVERGLCVVARRRADDGVTVHAVDRGDRATFPLGPTLVPATGHWSNYPMTVAARVAANFPGRLRGADVAVAGDLPAAAGLSSSSALVTAAFLALSDVNDLPSREEYRAAVRSPDDLCGYLGCIENGQTFGPLLGRRGVGTSGGSQDHTAILRSLPGHLVQYGFAPVRHEATVPLPPGHAFVIADSGVVAEKTGAAMARYNRASRTVAVLMDVWHRAGGAPAASLAAVVRSDPAGLRAALAGSGVAGFTVDGFTADVLLARLDQFTEESERIIPATAAALAAGRWDEVGVLVDRSQAAAELRLGNAVPETASLAADARRLGAVAATAFGAGFGGSAWALVPTADATPFAAAWSAAYAERFPGPAARARFYTTAAGPAATRVSDP